MGKRTRAQKETPQEAKQPERAVIITPCQVKLGTVRATDKDGTVTPFVLLDYVGQNVAGYLTIEANQAFQLLRDLCSVLGVPTTDVETPAGAAGAPDPTAKLVGPSGETLVQ